MSVDLSKAEEFIYRHARVLERHQYAGNHRAATTAVIAYQNDDGGFGNALEPDCRAAPSQPVATEWALRVLEEAGSLDHPAVKAAGEWCGTILTQEGALPFCLPNVEGWPRAPWWNPEGDPNPPNLVPTSGIVATLRNAKVKLDWLDRAEQWCLQTAIDSEKISQYAAPGVIALSKATSDTGAGEKVLSRLYDLLGSGEIVPLDPDAESGSDTHSPLQIVKSPYHPLRSSLKDDVVEVFLARLEAEQQEDGGWAVDWPAPGETAIGNWRAIRTIEALTVLRNYGRL
ncbi:MAG: hypothetical protein ACRD1T_00170 [Acidimicrobiia bacterium]